MSALRAGLLACAALACAGVAAVTAAQSGALEAQKRALESQPDLGPHARGALQQASRALAERQRAAHAGDSQAALRAERIASAALVLAERRLAQARAQGELGFLQRRSAELNDQIVEAKARLSVAQKQLDAIEAKERAPGEPGDAP